MKNIFLFILAANSFNGSAQLIDSLNTAKNCTYMNAEEREMIYEINRVRSNPGSYLPYIQPMLETAKQSLKKYGKGQKNYSVTYSTETVNVVEKKKTDTVWHYTTEEEVRALSSLVKDLQKLKKLPILQPDSGIYNAAKKHAADQDNHDWMLMHTGSDGSGPNDRITKFSPSMSYGNENIAGKYPKGTPRDIVIQLLVDSGIPGYGHRYNLLDPQWTYGACVSGGQHRLMYWWIQNFGVKKK